MPGFGKWFLVLLLFPGCTTLRNFYAHQWSDSVICVPICDKVLGAISTAKRFDRTCSCRVTEVSSRSLVQYSAEVDIKLYIASHPSVVPLEHQIAYSWLREPERLAELP